MPYRSIITKAFPPSAVPVYITIALFAVIIYFTQFYWSQEQLSQFITRLGPTGLAVYVLLVLLINIAAPISATPLLLLGFSLFGQWAIWLFALGNFGAMAANFWIARRFGRQLISRLIGQQNMNKIDELSKNYGLTTLFMVRLFMPSISDLASYAFGLSQIAFRPYLIVSFIATLPVNLLFTFFSHEDASSIELLLLQLVLAGILSALYIVARFLIRKFVRLLVWGELSPPKRVNQELYD